MLTHDSVESIIQPDDSYRFLPDVGLVPVLQNDIQTEHLDNTMGQFFFKGTDIIAMTQLGITDKTLNNWSKIHRQLIDHLLDYQPLQSRLLWQQQQRYQ